MLMGRIEANDNGPLARLAAYLVIVLALVVAMLGLSLCWVSDITSEQQTPPYESGILSQGSAQCAVV